MRSTRITLCFLATTWALALSEVGATPHPKVFAPNPNPAPADFITNVRLFTPPPFVHWDLREFPTCRVPWVLGPAPVPDIDNNGTANQAADRTAATNAFTGAFAAWGNVAPSIIDFTLAAAAAPATSGLALDGHNVLNFADGALDDCQVAPFGGPAGTGGVVVTPGANGMLDTAPIGDDMVMGTFIVDGGNNMAETNAMGDDCQAAPVGGPPVAAGVNVTAGPNGVLETQPQGDDMVAGTNIVDGGNGTSETRANNQFAVGSSLGLTGLFFNNRTGVLLESDIVFNPAVAWRTYGDGVVPAAGTSDLQTVATHEAGHFIGIAHPIDADDQQVRGPDDQQLIPVGNAALPGDMIVGPGGDGVLRTPPQGDEFVAGNFIFEPFVGGNGMADTLANNVAAGGVIVNAGPDGMLVTVPQGDDVVMGTNIVEPAVGGNGTADTRANNSPTLNSNPAPNAIMNPFYNRTLASNHQLAQTDTDSCNFLYTPDLGDAPDPFAAMSFEYPSRVHDAMNGRMLNGIQLDAPAPGAEHLFGFHGGGAVPRFQYEWLGTTLDENALECEALVPDQDGFDDGVTFGGIFIPGGGPIPVTVDVQVAADVEGGQHCYALGNPMYLNAWFDWNADGDWVDAQEYAIGPVGGFVKVFGPGPQTFMVSAPLGAVPGGFARFRLDWGEDGGQAPLPAPTPTGPVPVATGPTATHTCPTPIATPFGGRFDATLDRERGAAQFGEVEDYRLEISTLNHFQCYEVHAPVDPIPGITLEDQFGFSVVDALEPRRLCNPASKDSQDPTAAFDLQHLVGYRIKQITPKFADVRKLLGPQTIVNQFGTITVKLRKPDYLMVPSHKSIVAPPPTILPTIDHFKCYRIAGARERRSVQVDDQFGNMLLDVKKPRRLCAPVEKNSGIILDNATHLMCYSVRLSADPIEVFPRPGHVFVNNQFGPDEFDVFRPTELCVPSVKNPGS